MLADIGPGAEGRSACIRQEGEKRPDAHVILFEPPDRDDPGPGMSGMLRKSIVGLVSALLSRISGRIIVLSVLCFTPFVGLELYDLAEVRSRLTRTAQDHVQTLARAVALQHRSLIEAAQLALEHVALMEPVRTGSADECSIRLAIIRTTTRLFTNLARGTTDGTVDCSGLAGQNRFIAPAMPAVRQAAETSGFAVAAAGISPNHGKPVIPIARPLPAEGGLPIRILVAGINLMWLDRLVSDLNFSRETIVLVLDDQDMILASLSLIHI